MRLMTNLKRNIEQALIQRSLTLPMLAHRSGVQQSTLYRLISGDIKKPRVSTLAPLAEYLGTNIQTLLHGELTTSPTSKNIVDRVGPSDQQLNEQDLQGERSGWSIDVERQKFNLFLSIFVPGNYLNWDTRIHNNIYRLDYFSESLAVDLISHTPPKQNTDKFKKLVDYSALFRQAATHIVNLLVLKKKFPKVKALLLVLSQEQPDENTPPIRRLIDSCKDLEIILKFSDSGTSAAQIVMDLDSQCIACQPDQ